MEQLQSTITFLEAKIESAGGQTKEKYEAALEKAQLKLLELIDTVDTSIKSTSTSSETYKRNSQIKSIESALNETTFKGLDINETTRFVERLDKIFIITVTGKDPTLESDFLDLVKLRLSDAVFKNLHASQADVSTFDKFKLWIKTTYGGNFNAFQILQRAWDIEFKPEDKFTVYAQKVSEEMRTGAAAIQKQLTAIKGTSTVSTEDIEFTLEFIAALLTSNNLRSHCWPLYKDMVNDMDKMLTSAEVANKAEYYRERLGGDFLGKSTEVYWQKPKSDQKQTPSGGRKHNESKNASTGASSKPALKKSGPPTTKWKFNPKFHRRCRHCNQLHFDSDCPNKGGSTNMHSSGAQHAPGPSAPAASASIYAPKTPFC